MGAFLIPLGNQANVTLTIANGGTTSPALLVPEDMADLMVYGPAALTAQCVLQVEPSRTGTDFLTLQMTPGTDVTLAAAKATNVKATGFRQMRILSAGAEGADRAFTIVFTVQP